MEERQKELEQERKRELSCDGFLCSESERSRYRDKWEDR